MIAKLSLAGKCVPKLSLGTRKRVAAGFSLRPHRLGSLCHQRFHLMKTASKNSPFAKILDCLAGGAAAGGHRPGRAGGRQAGLAPGAVASRRTWRPCCRRRRRRSWRTWPRRPTASPGSTSGGPSGSTPPFICPTSATPTALYCGFALHSGSQGERRTLTPAEIRAECAVLAGHGFQNILLLTGEAPKAAPVSYLAQAVAIAREYFVSVAVEVYALDQADYRLLVDRGLEGVTLYMETYHRETYAAVHRRGRKRDYDYRLEAMARAGRAGVRRLSLGALLGLYHWWADGFWMGLHARHLQKECWQSAISLSFPRLRHAPERFQVQHLPTDRELVQLMLALRIFLPEVGFNLSTRESSQPARPLDPPGGDHDERRIVHPARRLRPPGQRRRPGAV